MSGVRDRNEANQSYGTSNGVIYDGSVEFDAGYILTYWRNRAKSGNQFDKDMYALIYKYDPHGTGLGSNVLSTDLGLLSYAIWKVMNVRSNRMEQNEHESADKNFAEIYKEGTKIENKKLILKDSKLSTFSSSKWAPISKTNVLVCEDPETNVKVNLRLSSNKNNETALYNLVNDARRFELMDQIFPIDIIVAKGTISKFDAQWKAVTINRVEISSPTAEEVEALEKKLYDLDKERTQKKKEEEMKKEENVSSSIPGDPKENIKKVFHDVISTSDEEKVIDIYRRSKKVAEEKPNELQFGVFTNQEFLEFLKDEFKQKFGKDIPEE